MRPLLFGVRLYPVVMAIAVAIAVALGHRRARGAGIGGRRWVAMQLALVAAAVVGAKLYSLVERGRLDVLPAAVLTWDGFRYPGGIVAAVGALPLVARLGGVPLAVLGDVVALPAVVAMAAMRVGCLLEGCCFGPVTAVPWALRFPAHSPAWNDHVVAGLLPGSASASLPVHPLQVYFGAWSATVALAARRLERRAAPPGTTLLAVLVLHDGGKALLEAWRVPPAPGLQWASAAVALAAAGLWAARRARRAAAVTSRPAGCGT